MDSFPVLRQQSQNKIRSDFQRLKNVQNKMPVQTTSVQPSCSPNLSKKNENKDPANKDIVKKASVLPRVSRLPVPVKNLRLQTPFDFSQSHCNWEEKPLTGKVKKKKCTRPIPFNLSQPKSSRANTDEGPLQTDLQSKNHLKNPNGNSKVSKPPAASDSNVHSTQGAGESQGKTPQTAGQCGPSRKFKTLANSHDSISTLPQNNSACSTQSYVEHMSLLTLKSSTKKVGPPQIMQTAVKDKTSECLKEKEVNFQSNHTDLLSILRSETVGSAAPTSATPKSKQQTFLRVSVKKSRQKAGPPADFMRVDHFSPDCAALRSILQNEGVKLGSLRVATPGQSACPSGRDTPMYRRVPVKKHQTEASVAATVLKLRESTVKKCTPQRVPNTRREPASAVKWNSTTPFSCTPGAQRVQKKFQQNQEEVVQRLFEDQEDEQGGNSETLADQPNEDTAERDNDIGSKDKQQGEAARPLFPQTPQRESVIFFSTGKKLLRAPCFEKQDNSACKVETGQLRSEQERLLLTVPVAPAAPPASPTGSLKTCTVSSAVAMLRKRFPPPEELRLDEEVATYTSAPVPPASGFAPSRPRCGNPLASVLHFEESTRFVPIDPTKLLD